MKKVISIVIVLILVIVIVFIYNNSDDDYDTVELIEKIKKKTNTNNLYYYFNIWNTSCIPCIREMPDIDSLAFLYKKKVDFIFITNESNEKIENFLKIKKIQLNNCVFLNDEENTISYLSERIGKQNLSYPTHIIMDDKFRVVHNHTGGGTMIINGVESFFDPKLTKALKNLK
jgi:thiol-disulfide isomerase/thioredoxin